MSVHVPEPRPTHWAGHRPDAPRIRVAVPADPGVEEVLALLDDPYARAILRETRGAALSARELSEACDVSISTVYRRAGRLVECGLLVERRIARPCGNHYTTYEARLDELTVRLTDEGFEVAVTERPTGDIADRFTDLWEGL